jgi:1-acyl-sn-glycerol-3-phosphate acyltransferase
MFEKIAGSIYTGWVILVFTIFMILFLPFFIIPVLISEKLGWITYTFLKLWAWIFSKLTFIRYKIRGREKVDWSRSYIFVANHTSYLDAPGLALGVKTQFRPLAKKELKKIPVFGWIVSAATVIVDRSSPQSRKESLERLKYILDQGISILIFPEGTQNRTNQPLQRFYDGAFRAAKQTSHPIVPIVIRNAGNLMRPGTLSLRPGTIEVYFESPINPDDFRDQATLRSHVYDIMLNRLTGSKTKPLTQVQ